MLKKRNGFTIVELLAVLVLLGIIMGIVLVTVNGGFSNAKNKTEEVFIGTIEDALNMYLNSSEAKSLDFDTQNSVCTIDKTHKLGVKIYEADSSFCNVINSEYHPIAASDLVNPANKDETCSNNVSIKIFRDEDYVYYYAVPKNSFNCLKDINGESGSYISNLPCKCLYKMYGIDSVPCNCVNELIANGTINNKPDRCKREG